MDQNHIEYISRVLPDDLATAIDSSPSGRDVGSEAICSEEKTYIRNWRKARGEDEAASSNDKDLIGLALSGGGIRSATFSLGIMQALVDRDLLKKVDYLSTVSGGGYIGSSVNWLTSKRAQVAEESQASQVETGREKPKEPRKFHTTKGDFPYGSDDPRPDSVREIKPKQKCMLKYLREHGYYLTPGMGINAFSLLAAILRGTLLNLLVWIPVFVLIFLLLIWLPGMIPADSVKGFSTPVYNNLLTELAPGISHPSLNNQEENDARKWSGHDEQWTLSPPTVKTVRGELRARGIFEDAHSENFRLVFFEVMLWLGLLLLAALVVSSMVYSIVTWFSRDREDKTRSKWYKLRSKSDIVVGAVIPVTIISLLVGLLPLAAITLDSWLAGIGPLAAISGVFIALRDFMASGKKGSGQSPDTLIKIGAGLFLYGVTICSYLIANDLVGRDSWYWLLTAMTAMVIILGWFVNVNYVSIHRYYRDRLMETFMPDIEDALENRTGRADGANTARLHDISDESDPHGPYHIVNTNVVLVSSGIPEYKSRGGDNFILSPLYCGSNATGWRRTDQFMDGKMTLATAVAISGAAANPNTGVGGVGLTRNLFVSLVMSLLNLRLGYWALHPNPQKMLKHSPNHFRPGAYALGNVMGNTNGGYRENRDFVQLSDGGHFENMALYELIRRRVKLAIVCDGGADLNFSFSDMQTTVRRIEDDFGARLKILDKDTPDMVVPDNPKPPCYPPDAGFARQGHMIGRITYADGSTGWLIFMKTTLIEEVSFKVKGYKAQNPSFPDETTADQFFDEVQFEAYRELGYCIADKMLNDEVKTDKGETKLKELIANSGAYNFPNP